VTNPTDPLIQRQIDLELEMRTIGTQRYEKMIADAKAGRRESETPYGSALLEDAVLPTAQKIRDYLKAHENPQGAVHTSIPYLTVVDNPELAAFQTAKAILDGISLQKEPMAVAKKIAGSLEDEVRMREFEDKNKAYLRTLLRSLDKRSRHAGYRKKVLVFSMNKAGIHWVGWPDRDKVHLGMKLIELFIEATGFVSLELEYKGAKDTPEVLCAAPKVLESITKKNASGAVMQPELLPMLVEPKDWKGAWGGGYISKAIPVQPLVKTFDRRYLEDIGSVEMPIVYQAINGLQKTKWQVNEEVLMVYREFWNLGIQVGDTPSKKLLEEPPKPHDIDTNPEAKKLWKRAANEVKNANIKQMSKIIQAAKILAIAEKFREEPTIYFPYQMDFRGRLYASPMFLNPQGPDHAKALLRFSEGIPLGDQEAVDWLAIHGANTYGVDKVSYDDRVAWVEENQEHIVKSAENPLDYLWWTKADSPWQFLAFCFEWYGYTIHGLDWPSKIPVALDGSCNGLQHFSAMLRDEIGGAAVNLVPQNKPADIYQTVCDRVVARIKDLNDPLAAAWRAFGLTRKGTKRCVMTLPYGATEFAFKAFTQEHIHEMGKGHLFGADLKNFKAATFLAGEIHRGIKETVVKAMEAMKWLQDIANEASATGLPIQWTTPSGFPVVQRYQKYKSKQVQTYLTGRKLQFRINEETPLIDRKRQANGVSPNFVHSMDASALAITVATSVPLGITDFAMIHDSYGTHAANTGVLAEILRESFVKLYQDRDVLEEFRQSVAENNQIPISKLPEHPSFGTLKIEGIFTSKYFFA
jgi:DNA-directed RNA polymerase